MGICLNCGIETEGCLCEDCRTIIDIENLCNAIIQYTAGVVDKPNANAVWETIAVAENKTGNTFKLKAGELADYLSSPRKEYQKLHSYFGDYVEINKDGISLLYELYPQLESSEGLSVWERNRLRGVMINVFAKEFQYSEAEKVVVSLERDEFPWHTSYSLAKYYINTRRYDEAEYYIQQGKKSNNNKENVLAKFEELEKENDSRRNGSKKEYLPKSENREKYRIAMKMIGIDIPKPVPIPIKEDDYPYFEEKKEADFNTFVVYDFETTGLRKNNNFGKDSIIEVGAIKVVNGKIVETKEYIFEEFVKPYEAVISEKVTEITTITKEDVEGARNMWEVIPDFMDFVGDSVLVGYNNVNFDSVFLRRAGRYSRKIYTNKQFDVLHYLKTIKDKIGYDGKNDKLETVAKYYGIENPSAHRALADAITTAKVFLKLKELDK